MSRKMSTEPMDFHAVTSLANTTRPALDPGWFLDDLDQGSGVDVVWIIVLAAFMYILYNSSQLAYATGMDPARLQGGRQNASHNVLSWLQRQSISQRRRRNANSSEPFILKPRQILRTILGRFPPDILERLRLEHKIFEAPTSILTAEALPRLIQDMLDGLLGLPPFETVRPKPPRELDEPEDEDEEIQVDLNNLHTSILVFINKLSFHVTDWRAFSDLNESLTLIKGASKSYWGMNQRTQLLRGAIWSHLMATIFAHPFAVFGSRASQLASEWRASDIEPFAELWRCMTSRSLAERAGLLIVDEASDDPSAKGELPVLGLPYLLEAVKNSSTAKVDPLDFNAMKAIYDAHQTLLAHACVGIIDRLIGELALSDEVRNKIRSSLIPALEDVVTKSMILALRMALQISRFQLVHPQLGATVDEGTLFTPDPSRYTSSGSPSRGRIAFVSSPALRKSVMKTSSSITFQDRYLVAAEVFLEAPAEQPTAHTRPTKTRQTHSAPLWRPRVDPLQSAYVDAAADGKMPQVQCTKCRRTVPHHELVPRNPGESRVALPIRAASEYPPLRLTDPDAPPMCTQCASREHPSLLVTNIQKDVVRETGTKAVTVYGFKILPTSPCGMKIVPTSNDGITIFLTPDVPGVRLDDRVPWGSGVHVEALPNNAGYCVWPRTPAARLRDAAGPHCKNLLLHQLPFGMDMKCYPTPAEAAIHITAKSRGNSQPQHNTNVGPRCMHTEFHIETVIPPGWFHICQRNTAEAKSRPETWCYQTITRLDSGNDCSLEELRVMDYANGRRYGPRRPAPPPRQVPRRGPPGVPTWVYPSDLGTGRTGSRNVKDLHIQPPGQPVDGESRSPHSPDMWKEWLQNPYTPLPPPDTDGENGRSLTQDLDELHRRLRRMGKALEEARQKEQEGNRHDESETGILDMWKRLRELLDQLERDIKQRFSAQQEAQAQKPDNGEPSSHLTLRELLEQQENDIKRGRRSK